MGMDCIPNALSNFLFITSHFIARHPWPFLVIPFIVTAATLGGLARFRIETDVELLYAPQNNKAQEERAYFDDNYVHNEDNFTDARRLRMLGFLQVLIKNKHGKQIFAEQSLNAANDIVNNILNRDYNYENENIVYADVCAQFQGSCSYNRITQILFMSNLSEVTYPFYVDHLGARHNLFTSFSRVTLRDNLYIESASTLFLSFNVRTKPVEMNERAVFWLDKTRDYLLNLNHPDLQIEFFTSETIRQEIAGLLGGLVVYAAVMAIVMVLFSVVATLMWDAVRSKPEVALAGLTCAGLGVISSLGLVTACGIPFITVAGAMPFLVIGIGIDDMFILVSAWRHTSIHLPSEERVAQTFKHAAVSISITTATDVAAFGIGCLNPMLSIRYFCAYTGVALVFTYLYIISMMAAIMALSGRREQAGWAFYAPLACCHPKKQKFRTHYYLDEKPNDRRSSRRPYSLKEKHRRPSPYNSESGYNNSTYGTDKDSTYQVPNLSANMNGSNYNTRVSRYSDQSGRKRRLKIKPQMSDEIKLPFLSVFLGNQFVEFITKWPVKVIVVLMYWTGLAFAIYGCFHLKQGLTPERLAPDDSYFRDYYDILTDEFPKLMDPRLQVSFEGSLDYTNQEVIDKLHHVVEELRTMKFVSNDDNDITSWHNTARDYLAAQGRNITALTMPELIVILKNEIFTIEGFEPLQLDVVFSNDMTEIIRSRIMIQTQNVEPGYDENIIMQFGRNLTATSELNIVIYAINYPFVEQYNVILSTLLTSLGIAVACIFVISIILIPSIVTAFLITFTTISICVYVTGFLALWDAGLDFISMVNIINSVGFSVDFAAHILYHFVIDDSETTKESTRVALGSLGNPIVYGALSTLLTVFVLAFSNSYTFRIFFKVNSLTMIFGFAHSMFLLPVLFSLIRCNFCRKREVSNNSVNESHFDTYNWPCKERAQLKRYSVNSERHMGRIRNGERCSGLSVLPWYEYEYTSKALSQEKRPCVLYSQTNNYNPGRVLYRYQSQYM